MTARGAGRWTAAAALLLAAGAAHAQGPDRESMHQMISADSVLRATLRAIQNTPAPDPQALRGSFLMTLEPYSSREPAALEPRDRARIQHAVVMRNQGQFAASRDSLAPLLARLPHHAVVLTEWCRTLLALEEYASIERLARAERASQADSVLLARPLADSQERLGRPTDAALTAVEAWAASALMGRWADGQLRRPIPYDVPRVREAMRRAVAHDPSRGDLAAALARLDWRAHDTPAMLRSLRAASASGAPGSPRETFAEELLQGGATSDTSSALEILIDLASDRSLAGSMRSYAARRTWTLYLARGATAEGAPRLATALSDLPGNQWEPALALEIARSLRESGHTQQARALLQAAPQDAGSDALALERALNDLRDGPPARALPELARLASRSSVAAYTYAEALFFDGRCDSAHTWYLKSGGDIGGEKTGAALERAFLIEDAAPKEALPAYARACYAAWRGESHAAIAITDSLYHSLPRRSLWAEVAMMLSAQRADNGEMRAALEPLLALADSLPESRLASLARQRAGDLYRDALQEPKLAIEQYEACLTRYPGAWNAPAVRRSLEALRRERRL
ncbi:MAG: hypothetical protein ACRENS_04975 [Candidatus Eiseniibacteriota bacterium]